MPVCRNERRRHPSDALPRPTVRRSPPLLAAHDRAGSRWAVGGGGEPLRPPPATGIGASYRAPKRGRLPARPRPRTLPLVLAPPPLGDNGVFQVGASIVHPPRRGVRRRCRESIGPTRRVAGRQTMNPYTLKKNLRRFRGRGGRTGFRVVTCRVGRRPTSDAGSDLLQSSPARPDLSRPSNRAGGDLSAMADPDDRPRVRQPPTAVGRRTSPPRYVRPNVRSHGRENGQGVPSAGPPLVKDGDGRVVRNPNEELGCAADPTRGWSGLSDYTFAVERARLHPGRSSRSSPGLKLEEAPGRPERIPAGGSRSRLDELARIRVSVDLWIPRPRARGDRPWSGRTVFGSTSTKSLLRHQPVPTGGWASIPRLLIRSAHPSPTEPRRGWFISWTEAKKATEILPSWATSFRHPVPVSFPAPERCTGPTLVGQGLTGWGGGWGGWSQAGLIKATSAI